MNKIDWDEEAQETAAALLPLLKEYTTTMQGVSRRIRRYQKTVEGAMRKEENPQVDKSHVITRITTEMQLIRNQLNRIRPATTQLVQAASQNYQHGKIKQATRIELALRTAELEAEMQTVQQLANTKI